MFEAEPIAGTEFERTRLRDCLRLPFRKYEFTTPMSPAHAARILQEKVEPRKTFRWSNQGDYRYFEGRVEGDQFKISRIIKGRNSFLPIIVGTFREENPGTVVTLNMRMAWPVMIFWSGFILALLWFFLGSKNVVPIGMLLFAYFLATVCFAIEVRIAIKRLLDLLRSSDSP